MSEILTPYEKVLAARKPDRPGVVDYIREVFDDFIELKGDRLGKEDSSILGGIALFNDRPVTVIGHRKGKDAIENSKYNFGMASPEGYRKAKRLMAEAERFNRPVITFIDTPGAYPGLEAESNGQSTAIAENLAFMSSLRVPVLAIVTGEGSSGGALGIGVANKTYMLENAVYSILSPEGFATIMWKDSKKTKEACEVMKLTAQEIYEFGLIDGIIAEDKKLFESVKSVIANELKYYDRLSGDEIADDRYNKYREMGEVIEQR